MDNQPAEQFQQSSPREQYELKRQQKLNAKAGTGRKKTVKKNSIIALAVLLAVGSIGWFIWYLAKQPQVPESETISKNGIHWHPELTISLKGEIQKISANIGIGVKHQGIHTHDSTGVLHVEVQGRVRKADTTLGRFFKIWGKQFNSSCILSAQGGSASGGEFCNGPDGKLKMFVNGEENSEFENYPMKDGDKIEIRYE